MKDPIDDRLDAIRHMLDHKRLNEACLCDVKPLLQRVRYLEAQVEHDKLIRDSYCRQLDAADQRVNELENSLAGVLFEFGKIVWPAALIVKVSNLVKAKEFKS